MTSSTSSSIPKIVRRSRVPVTRLRLVLLALVAAAFFLAPTAQAAAAEVALEVNITGGGEGAVGCEVEGGPLEECEEEYEEGKKVTVIAEPELGSEFVEWNGECDTVVGSKCEVEMNAEKTIEVVFDLEEFELTVEAEGTGVGVVECQVESEPYELCPEAETYPYGTEVTLYAEPEEGSEFVEWGGDCSGVEIECQLTVEEPLGVTATFAPEPPFELTIETGGTGTGEFECEVEGEPAEACDPEAEYEEGTPITVIAKAKSGSEFIGWSGECDTIAGNECEVEMNADKTVKATFKLISRTLTITEAGTGSGEVKCKFNGGSAGACTSPQPNGTTVEVIATAKSGSTFAGFSSGTGSAAACTTSPCSFTLEANSAVTATFTPISRTLTITEAGTGSGEVKCKFNGGSAGACTSPQPNGTTVEVIATAKSGSTFAGFSSGTGSAAACTTSPCSFTLEANSAVTATFTANSKEETKKEETKKEEVKPPPPGEGTAKAAATAKVKSGKAELKLTCSGGPCKGTIQLKAKVKQGKKTKNLVIGKASFSIADGASATIKVKLSGPAKQELAKGKTLKAKTSGSGVSASTVKLKPPKK